MESRSIKRKPEIREMTEKSPAQIEGYASVYWDGSPGSEYWLEKDAVERIMPGTFNKHLASGEEVVALFNHDSNLVLGRRSVDTLRLRSDTTGLKYQIDLPNTQLAKDLNEQIRRGDINGSSFSFYITDEKWRTENNVDIREIYGVKIFDVGPVTFEAYGNTTAESRGKLDHVQEARESRARFKASSLPLSLRRPKAKLERWKEIESGINTGKKPPKLLEKELGKDKIVKS